MPIEDYPNLRRPSAEEAREKGRAGGIASGESRRRRKTFAEGLRQLLAMPEDDPTLRDALRALGLEGTMQDAINLAQIKQAKRGDTDSFRVVRDTIGEKPRDELEIGGLADRPIQTIDLSKLTDDELRELMAARSEGT